MTSFAVPPSLRFLRRRPGLCAKAFSLIELLVVMAIILLLAAVGVGALRDGGRSTAVSTAASTVSNAVSAARQLAITKNCRTRFFIVTGSSEPDWELRRYGVLRVPEDEDDFNPDGDVPFELASRMDILPTGVYFRPNTHFTRNINSSRTMFSSQANAEINGRTVQYAYIEFLPSGGTAASSSSNIFELVQAPSAEQDIPNNRNYIGIGVAQSTGRVKFERPDME